MATAKKRPHPLLKADAIARAKKQRRVHRLNPKGVRHGISLGDAVGIQNIGIHLVRVAHGDETTEYHTHHCDEEFLYILSGRGIAEIDGKKFEIGPGDFMGFVAQSVPHTMSNPFKDDLVYLMGGTRKPFDVSDYPRVRKRTYKFAGKRHTVDYGDVEEG